MTTQRDIANSLVSQKAAGSDLLATELEETKKGLMRLEVSDAINCCLSVCLLVCPF